MKLALLLGKDLGKKSSSSISIELHRINGLYDLVRSHNPKVVGSNPTPATILRQKRPELAKNADSGLSFLLANRLRIEIPQVDAWRLDGTRHPVLTEGQRWRRSPERLLAS
jgi:hypothetical protein